MVENVTQIISGITINANVSAKIWENSFWKNYIWNLSACTCENRKYSESIIYDSVITCDKIIKATKTIPTKTISAKAAPTSFYILFTFSLITIALLIALNIYCYLIKYQLKQEHLLSYHVTNKKLQEIVVNNII